MPMWLVRFGGVRYQGDAQMNANETTGQGGMPVRRRVSWMLTASLLAAPLVSGGCRYVVEGANMPTSAEAIAYLKDQGVG